MAWTLEAIRRRLGLETDGPPVRQEPVHLTGASSDPKTGFIAALSSQTTFNPTGAPAETRIDYIRHLPRGQSHTHGLIRATFEAGPEGVEPSEIWVQSQLVFDKTRDDPADPAVQKRVNRVLGAVSRINALLRNQEPVEDAAKLLLKECKLDEVTGEALVLRGLEASGGFSPMYLPAAFAQAANDNGPLAFRGVDMDGLKTLLGFRRNTLDPARNHTGDRVVSRTDPDTGIGYVAGVRMRETARGLDVEIHAGPEDVPKGMDPKAIPDLVSFSFRKEGDAFVLREAKLMGEPVDPSDTKKALAAIGIMQAANADFAKRRYPAFVGDMYRFDLESAINPLPPPPPGGEMLYSSLHGSGTEKRIENIGDQVGIAALFLRRDWGADGKIGTTGIAVDMPFASGGPDGAHDGALPDYLRFMKDIKVFAFTHKHVDHKGAFKYYVEKGLMQDKTVVASERDMFFLRKDLQGIPRKLWPKMVEVSKEGAMPVRDDAGNIAFWLQYCPEATDHSALCSPYIVTGCRNDEKYFGSACVYGDSRGFVEDKKHFFRRGTRALPECAAAQGITVTPEKVDRDITVALHDVTSVRDLGPSPDRPEVTRNIAAVMGWYKDKIKVFDPISTNDAEYVIGLDVAALSNPPLNVTAVGANAEIQMASKNIFGVNPDLRLHGIRLSAHDVRVTEEVRAAYGAFLAARATLGARLDGGEDDEKYAAAVKRLCKRHADDFAEARPAPGPFRDTQAYMLDRLMRDGAVTFDNNVNGYLMWKAVEAGRDAAASYHTRGSVAARDFRDNPGSLMVFTTGTQGTVEERFSTLQKFIDGMSLLDADEKVRPTGYKLDAKNTAWIIPQSAIVGNENAQRAMVDALVRSRGVDAVVAFRDGFTVHNLRGRRAAVVQELKEKGKSFQSARGDGIEVFAMPIHFNGHGHQPEIAETVKIVRADLHAPHHIPDANAIVQFNALLDRNNIPRVHETPDDFKVWRIDAAGEGQGKFTRIAHLKPSYIFVRTDRKYGQMYGGSLEWTPVTVLKREGLHRDDALHAAEPPDGVFKKGTASAAWGHMTNPKEWQRDPAYLRRRRKMGASPENRRPPQTQRSRPMLSAHMPRRKIA